MFRAQQSAEAPNAALLSAYFTSGAESMVVLDADLNVVAANDVALGEFGLTASSAQDFTELIAPESRAAAICQLEGAVVDAAERCHGIVVHCRRATGEAFPAKLAAAPFDFEGERMVGVIVHDRTAVEADLEQHFGEKRLYESLFDLTPIPLREEDFSAVGHWFDRLRADGVKSLKTHLKENPGELIDAIMSIRTVRVNRAMLELMGAESVDDLESFSRDEMTDEVLDSFRGEFVTLWNGDTYHETEFVGLDLHGNPFECLLMLTAESAAGELDLSRVVVALQDVTKVRAYQRTLENLIAGKDRFVASISHELRTPLASVLGLAEELHNLWDHFEADEARELMGLIAMGASDLATLVEDLLLAAQVEVGNGIPAKPEEFELGIEVDKAVADCITAGELSMRPMMQTMPNVRCFADPLRVRQIVRNLVTNAARYGGDTVEVVVREDPTPTVEVCDDGPGIPRADWNRIFSPYEQVAGGDGTRGALGLGLAISKQLADAMEGDLTYRYGDGISTFTLTLPATQPAEI